MAAQYNRYSNEITESNVAFCFLFGHIFSSPSLRTLSLQVRTVANISLVYFTLFFYLYFIYLLTYLLYVFRANLLSFVSFLRSPTFLGQGISTYGVAYDIQVKHLYWRVGG
jgi:hypothetical protein